MGWAKSSIDSKLPWSLLLRRCGLRVANVVDETSATCTAGRCLWRRLTHLTQQNMPIAVTDTAMVTITTVPFTWKAVEIAIITVVVSVDCDVRVVAVAFIVTFLKSSSSAAGRGKGIGHLGVLFVVVVVAADSAAASSHLSVQNGDWIHRQVLTCQCRCTQVDLGGPASEVSNNKCTARPEVGPRAVFDGHHCRGV